MMCLLFSFDQNWRFSPDSEWLNSPDSNTSKYLNRYAALFVLVREYSGCDVQEILLSIKKRMHQITDFFRIVDMKSKDLFIY